MACRFQHDGVHACCYTCPADVQCAAKGLAQQCLGRSLHLEILKLGTYAEQAVGEVYATHAARLPQPAVVTMLDTLAGVTSHARSLDSHVRLRHALAAAQVQDQVGAHTCTLWHALVISRL